MIQTDTTTNVSNLLLIMCNLFIAPKKSIMLTKSKAHLTPLLCCLMKIIRDVPLKLTMNEYESSYA